MGEGRASGKGKGVELASWDDRGRNFPSSLLTACPLAPILQTEHGVDLVTLAYRRADLWILASRECGEHLDESALRNDRDTNANRPPPYSSGHSTRPSFSMNKRRARWEMSLLWSL